MLSNRYFTLTVSTVSPLATYVVSPLIASILHRLLYVLFGGISRCHNFHQSAHDFQYPLVLHRSEACAKSKMHRQHSPIPLRIPYIDHPNKAQYSPLNRLYDSDSSCPTNAGNPTTFPMYWKWWSLH